jgi:hypothetical protein
MLRAQDGKAFQFSHWTPFESNPEVAVSIAPSSSTRGKMEYRNAWNLGGIEAPLTIQCSYSGTAEKITSTMPGLSLRGRGKSHVAGHLPATAKSKVPAQATCSALLCRCDRAALSSDRLTIVQIRRPPCV